MLIISFSRLAKAISLDPKYVKVRTPDLRLVILAPIHLRTLHLRLTSGAYLSWSPFFLGIQDINLRVQSTAHITRRAQCHLQMLKPQLAIGDFKKVIAIEPHNKTVKQQLDATQKLVRRIEFEKVGRPRDLVTL